MNSITLRRQFSCIRGAKSCPLCVSADSAEAELRMGVLCAHCTVPQYLTEEGSGLQHSDDHTATLFKSVIRAWRGLSRAVRGDSAQYGRAVADLGEGQGAAAPLARKVAQSGPLWAL